jgi:hypothetical protein
VIQDQHMQGMPWWETEIPLIRKELLLYLRRRVPALKSEHDDLLNDTLLGLTENVQQRRSNLPQSWFLDSVPNDESDRSHLHGLATLILKRRIADLFRRRASNRLVPIEEVEQELPDFQPQVGDREVILSKMLEVTLKVLDEMSPKDRDLVAFVSRNIGLRQGLNARDRQRLHRVRKKLKDEIARHLGAEAVELLRIAD